jgi:hypothetical protein
VVTPLHEWIDLPEDQLFALRTLCLIRLRVIEQEEEYLQCVDRYGEGDDEIICLLHQAWDQLAEMTKEQVTSQYRFWSRVEILARNSRHP